MTPPSKHRFFTGVIFLYVIAIVFIDQLIKFVVLRDFTPGQSLPIIKSVFNITLVFNRGGAFGIFTNATYAFTFVSIFVIAVISWFLFKGNVRYDLRLALASITAGAVSNLIDRLRFGYVVDFLDFRIWPVFNIADSAITIGTLWLVYYVIAKKARC
jgi:signal peptidase II